MEKLVGDPEALTRYSIDDLVEQAGTQGVEVINWLIARAALGGSVSEVHRNYHIPISNTASGIMVLANAA
jgi:protocatechuate 4,5-dioxygenase beta chain